jgi:predicted SAM-dependent methyltransferase
MARLRIRNQKVLEDEQRAVCFVEMDEFSRESQRVTAVKFQNGRNRLKKLIFKIVIRY